MNKDVTEMYGILTDAFLGFLAKSDGLLGLLGNKPVGMKHKDADAGWV